VLGKGFERELIVPIRCFFDLILAFFAKKPYNRKMSWKSEWKYLLWIVVGFLACFYLPVGNARFDHAVLEAFHLVKWYAQEHVLLCLIPAFFIAGAIGVFVSQGAVMNYTVNG
jgi:uncharacterized membrane protein SpoIIM required for sporulation